MGRWQARQKKLALEDTGLSQNSARNEAWVRACHLGLSFSRKGILLGDLQGFSILHFTEVNRIWEYILDQGNIDVLNEH